MKPKLVAVVGPTASGKTSLGIRLAQQCSGEVISVDSRQIYKGTDIGTAKPEGDWRPLDAKNPESELFQKKDITSLLGEKVLYVDGVPHWGIDLIAPDQTYSAAEFKEYAEQKIKEILARGHVPILVGGTGLWFQAIIDNLSFPNVPPNEELRSELEERPLDELFSEYQSVDPAGSLEIDRFNRRRLVRAIEVSRELGKPFSAVRTSGEPLYDVIQFGVHVEKDVLEERINERVDAMIARGLVEEVRGLKKVYGCDVPAMSGIGYRQICFFLDGKANLEAAIEDTKKDTRHYAKRQMTWFKRDARIKWVSTAEDATKQAAGFLN